MYLADSALSVETEWLECWGWGMTEPYGRHTFRLGVDLELNLKDPDSRHSLKSRFYHNINHLVGGKATGLMFMSMLGMDTPPGVVVPIAEVNSKVPDNASAYFTSARKASVKSICETIDTHSDQRGPTLFSVRSGAEVSMPGMMSTVLNCGILDPSVWKAFLEDGFYTEGNLWYLKWNHLRTFYEAAGVSSDSIDLLVRAAEGKYPEDPLPHQCELLWDYGFQKTGVTPATNQYKNIFQCMLMVKASFNSDHCKEYRRRNHIDVDGTAIIIQEVALTIKAVMGYSGVATSCDANEWRDHDFAYVKMASLFGGSSNRLRFTLHGEAEVVFGSQGNSLVSGTIKGERLSPTRWPGKLVEYVSILSSLFGSIVEVEFAQGDNGGLYMLQVRESKVAPKVAIKAAIERIESESLLFDAEDPAKAREELSASLKRNLTPLESALKTPPLRHYGVSEGGVEIGSGVAVGPESSDKAILVSSAQHADECIESGIPYLWHSNTTTPEHYKYMVNSVGVVTLNGGKMSHAAVVAQQGNIPTIVSLNHDSLIAPQSGALYSIQPTGLLVCH